MSDLAGTLLSFYNDSCSFLDNIVLCLVCGKPEMQNWVSLIFNLIDILETLSTFLLQATLVSCPT